MHAPTNRIRFGSYCRGYEEKRRKLTQALDRRLISASHKLMNQRLWSTTSKSKAKTRVITVISRIKKGLAAVHWFDFGAMQEKRRPFHAQAINYWDHQDDIVEDQSRRPRHTRASLMKSKKAEETQYCWICAARLTDRIEDFSFLNSQEQKNYGFREKRVGAMKL